MTPQFTSAWERAEHKRQIAAREALVDSITNAWLEAAGFEPGKAIEMMFANKEQFKICIHKVLDLAGVKP